MTTIPISEQKNAVDANIDISGVAITEIDEDGSKTTVYIRKEDFHTLIAALQQAISNE